MVADCDRRVMVMLLMLILRCSTDDFVAEASQVPAMFVFGDSIVDTGNNNFINSIAKANYYPYGCDSFSGFPTGRFCNGKTVVDFMGEMLGITVPPPFADPATTGDRLSGGVSYASAASGILEDTGKHYIERFTLSQQVVNFQATLDQLRILMTPEDLAKYLAKSLAFMVFGSNDYINNYLMPSMYPSSYRYTPPDFANLLLNHYGRQIVALHSLGLRKFYLAGVPPLGCIPSQLAIGQPPEGECVDYVNQILGTFNEGLRSLVISLNRDHPGAVFVYGNIYGIVGDMLYNPHNFGLSVVNRGCCGSGRNQGQLTCMPFQPPCFNRKSHLFWDAYHTTEAANYVIAQRAYSGPPSDCFPMNIQQMAAIDI
ncbi:hypothetical protein AgCh_026495 [Apium graveolens]